MKMKIKWQSLAPIFADVMVSPWNLLIGGLLIRNLSTAKAFWSIFIGYLILGLIFVVYGGLGFRKRQQSAEILSGLFGTKLTNYAVPIILALGQIGWAGINIELGGRSLAEISSFSMVMGVTVYALALILIATLSLHKQGIVKLFIVASSLIFMVYILWAKALQVTWPDFILHRPVSNKSLFWGISVVVASLISFYTVTPDFFQSVKEKKDVFFSTIFGLFLPGVLMALLGCFLFFDKGDFDLVALISSLTFPLFPHILNSSTNTDGAVALYTPGWKLEGLFKIRLRLGIIVSGFISFLLALLQISTYLEIWLKFLSLLFPALIGCSFIPLVYKETRTGERFRRNLTASFLIAVFSSLMLIRYLPPVIISLLAPLLVFSLWRRVTISWGRAKC